MLPAKLSRYAALANLLMKYGSRLSSSAGRADGLASAPKLVPEAEAKSAVEFAADLEKIGPTFVKLGQLLSTRSDLLPPAYLEALSRLQDNVEPVPAADVYQTFEEDLGVKRVEARFHGSIPSRSRPRHSGRCIVPRFETAVRSRSRSSVRTSRHRCRPISVVLDEIAAFVDQHTQTGRRYEFAPMVREFRKALMVELEYKQEASHLRTLGRNLAEFARIVVPAPIDDYVSTRVLTMEYISGTKVTALNQVTLVGLDREGLADELIRAYLHQILIDGFFHADPHPGNVLVTEDGRLALFDLGMIGHLSPSHAGPAAEAHPRHQRRPRRRCGRRRPWRWASCARASTRPDSRRDVVDLVGHYQGASLADLQLGRIVLEREPVRGRARPQAARRAHDARQDALEPRQGRPIACAVTRHQRVDSPERGGADAAPASEERVAQRTVFSTMLEAKEFAEQLPRRINRVLESLASSQLKLKVEMIDEGAVIDGLQKVANRITLGLVLAALIVSAAMMMRIESRFTLLGYPGFPTLLLVVAGSIGLWLVAHIVASDRVSKHRTKT